MTTLSGHCHCGKNTFTVNSEPEFQFICYCNDCRVINSGGHLCGLMFDQANFSEAKETASYTYDGGSGNPIIMHFCSTCATHLYAYPMEYAGKVVVRANTLDQENFNSQQSLFVESAFFWDKPIVDHNV